MPFFNDSFKETDDPPEWAAFLTPFEYKTFRKYVLEYFRAAGRKIELHGGTVTMTDQQYGLTNLAQLCRRNELKDWKDIIAAHFQSLEKARADFEELQNKPADFSRIVELLAVRLFPGDYLDGFGQKVVCREDIEDIASLLVLDLPTTFQSVTPETAQDWGKSPDELFRVALDNVRRKVRPETTDFAVLDDLTLKVLTGNDFLVSSHALLLSEHPECVGTYGALVGIPTRQTVVCYPIETIRVIEAINVMIVIVGGLYRDGPGAVSSDLYWYRDGAFHKIPRGQTDEGWSVAPPPAFVELLEILTEHQA